MLEGHKEEPCGWGSEEAGCHEEGLEGPYSGTTQRQVLKWSPKDYCPRLFLPLEIALFKLLGLPSCNPMVSGKGFLEDEQLSGLFGLSGAWGDLRPRVDLPEHSVRYTLFGLSF